MSVAYITNISSCYQNCALKSDRQCQTNYVQEAFKEGRAAKQAKEEYEWGRGLVQKEKDDEFKKELADIKNAPFAR